MNKNFLLITWVRNFITLGIPTIISVVGIITSLIDMSGELKIGLIIVSVILLVLFLRVIFWYSKNDDSYAEIVKELRADLSAYQGIVSAYTRLFETWAHNIYDFTGLAKKNEASNRSWYKNGYYDTICLQCCEMIKRYCDNNDNISVSFIECGINEKGEEFIEMVSDTNPTPARPSVYRKEESLSESKFHYANLVKEGFTGIETALNNTEVRRLHGTIKENNDLSNCSQYIAVPIYCKENKILGIFQILTEYDCIIEENEELMRKFVSEKISPYTNSILLVDKIHKGLYLLSKPIEQ